MTKRKEHRQTFEDRWMKSFIKRGPDECWPWKVVWKDQYGRIRKDGRAINAHRCAWILAFGPIPDGLFVCHHCDKKTCVNPTHLFLGTCKDNANDMLRKFGHPMAKLTVEQVLAIREAKARGEPMKTIAERFKLSLGGAYEVANNRAWRYV